MALHVCTAANKDSIMAGDVALVFSTGFCFVLFQVLTRGFRREF